MKNKASDRRIFLLHTLCGAVIALCAAAAGHAQTTTLGTRGVLARANAPLTTNASATWGTTAYDRAADYPNALTLPLQFITLSSGKRRKPPTASTWPPSWAWS
jgi:hypothetical protein